VVDERVHLGVSRRCQDDGPPGIVGQQVQLGHEAVEVGLRALLLLLAGGVRLRGARQREVELDRALCAHAHCAAEGQIAAGEGGQLVSAYGGEHFD